MSSCNINSCKILIMNDLSVVQPATMQCGNRCFYPTNDNIESNRLGIDSDVIRAIKAKPFFERLVSMYHYKQSNPMFVSGDLIRLGKIVNVDAITEDPILFTPCCTLSYRIQNNKPIYYPIAYTCLLDFDITTLDNAEVDMIELKQELCAIPQIAYCGNRYNDDGLWCIVPILSPQRYLDHAETLRRLFRKTGIIINIDDEIVHTRLANYDPQAYFNDDAKEFTLLY